MSPADLTINAGDLRVPLTIQRATRATDATYGESQLTWADWKIRWWSEVRPLQGRELERARAVAATVSHLVITRHCTGLRPDDRLVLPGGRVLNVDAVINVMERGVKHVLYCTEVLS